MKSANHCQNVNQVKTRQPRSFTLNSSRPCNLVLYIYVGGPQAKVHKPSTYKRMDVKNVFDVSSFFFFEATGDSEADVVVDPNMPTTINHEDDDAESCSYNLSGYAYACDVNNCFGAQAVHVDDQVEEGEEVHSYRTWSNEQKNGLPLPGDKKSNDTVDSSEKLTTEMEKNKLFWENCLAS